MNTPIKFELAKLLKEKGFICMKSDKFWRDGFSFDKKDYSQITYQDKDNVATIAEVVMWLYEKHGIWIQAISKNTSIQMSFKYEIKRYEWDGCITDDNLCNFPTEAYEAAIEYCLTKLIEQHETN